VTISTSSGAVAAPPDKQGEAKDGERVERAMNAFVKDFGMLAAVYLETCVHCGMCADACHFYEVTKEPKYTPILKVEPFKQAYKREYGPFAPVFRLFNLKPKVTIDELENWQELLYESCNVCGRCSLVCPMGIDIAGLIAEARHGMAAAGLVPDELLRRDDVDKSAAAGFKDKLDELARAHGIEIPIDRPTADVVCMLFAVDLENYPKSVVAIAQIMNHLRLSWTFASGAFAADNLDFVSGRHDAQQSASRKLVDATTAIGAHTLILPECGHAYGAMRWEAANDYGKPLPFKILHISEFLADQVQAGTLNFTAVGKSATFHDPCQVSRRGGAIDAPRVVLAALGLEIKEMFPTKGTNWCCGGGGGVAAIGRADELRHKVFRLKMAQIEDTGAEMAVTSCSGCRRTFDDGQAHFHWDKSMNSLVELVADHLAEVPA
jgi:Fe-S oxidoreductase